MLVVTTMPCTRLSDGADGIQITLIDPDTGGVLPAQAIVACGDKDWEVTQLCDFDAETGALIAMFIQVFEWDESTGSLVITSVRADDPTMPYTPTGEVRACTVSSSDAYVVLTDFCYDDAGVTRRGWHGWVFINDTHISDLYYDDTGGVLAAPTIVACPDLAFSVERKFDGDDLSGVDTITIPDGVLSFSVTVRSIGGGVTIDGPDMVAKPLFAGQSIGASADGNNTINGPITIVGTGGSVVNAFWVFP